MRINPRELKYTQADITENFGDNERLGKDDWIMTTPLNLTTKDPETMGLPPASATPDEIYRISEGMSQLRESVSVPGDGVYCPVCHIANIDLKRLRTPCPKCQRPLLKFGWD